MLADTVHVQQGNTTVVQRGRAMASDLLMEKTRIVNLSLFDG